MGYKIKDLTESELGWFQGQIIAVLKSEQHRKLTGFSGGTGSNPIYESFWVVTCLVKE